MPRAITHPFTRFLAAMTTIFAGPVALAADNPGAHEHGQAQLQLVLSNNQIELMFTSPAYNLAGFEHQARTSQEKQRLADVHDWLKTTPLITRASGGCTITAAQVRLGGEPHDHHNHGDHSSSHRDFEVTQQLNCEADADDGIFRSGLPARFPELEVLTVEWVGPSGQGSARVTSAAPTFRLGD